MDAVNAAQKSRWTPGSAKSEGRNPSKTTVLSTGRTCTLASATVTSVAARRRAAASAGEGRGRRAEEGDIAPLLRLAEAIAAGGGVGARGEWVPDEKGFLLGTVPP